MTDAEWLASNDPVAMIEFASGHGKGIWDRARHGESPAWPPALACCLCARSACKAGGGPCPTYRLLRLFACACCRRVRHRVPGTEASRAIEAAEDFADGPGGDESSWWLPAKVYDTFRRGRFQTADPPKRVVESLKNVPLIH